MHSRLTRLVLVAFLMTPVSARAAFHLWDIVEVYSNADGSVQYIEFFTDDPDEEFLTGRTLTSNANPLGSNNPFFFPNDLPSEPDTANRSFLVATPDFAAQCDNAFSPDYTFAAANFHHLVADTLEFGEVATPPLDTLTYTSGELPTDGYYALHEDFGDITGATRTIAPNSPTNFAGQVCLPEPSGWPMQVAGLAGVLGLARWRRRRAQH